VFALRGRGDQPIGFATVSRNITERKHMEQALRRSQDDLNRAQAVAHTGSWRMDVRHNVLTWSDENHRIFGIPRGKPLSYETFLGAVHPDDRGFVDRAWTMALAGKPYDIEHRIVVGDTVKWVRERAELEYDEYGFLLGGFGTTQDITELKNSQLALREADRRKDEFLAMLAHELRNPLTPIMVAAQMLQKRGASDPSLVTWAGDTVKHQCDHLVQLVNQLLDVSRVTQGKIALHKSPWDLRELAQRAVDSNKPFIEQHRHRLVVALPAEPMLAEVDAVRIEQVVGNLLNNAAKYTPISGDITLSLERQGDEAVIRVRDNGIGISSAMLPCIFDLFVQDERTLDRAQGGLGIGLALVKTLVEMHGGRVQAHSDGAGKGSQFELHLPLLAHSAGAISSYRGTALQGTPGKSRRILVVDDNDSVRESLVLLIQGMGHEVSEAANGLEALNKAKHARFDVVLLDIGMPGMNGYEVARRLRQDPGLAGLTLIALSGYSQGVDRRESFRAGFDHYLVKPLNPEELNMLLEDLDI
jgi:signal transduction histidine kinase